MFGKWYDSLIEIKKEGGHSGKAVKKLLVSLWGYYVKREIANSIGHIYKLSHFY